jgi:hypothetical protein
MLLPEEIYIFCFPEYTFRNNVVSLQGTSRSTLAGLPAGTYFARIVTAYGEVQTVKLVKE